MIQILTKMNKGKFKLFRIGFYLLFVCSMVSCENVTDGYTVDYGASSAELSVTLQTSDRGSEGDIAVFHIVAQANAEIKSLIISSESDGAEGTGFVVDTTLGSDPLTDHIFGTIQPGTTDFALDYHYVFPSDTTDNTITFSLIDEEGIAEVEFDLEGIANITAYSNIALVALSSKYLDGFSTAEGSVYENVADYADETAANLLIQKSIDICFKVSSDGISHIFCPYHANFGVDFSNTNKTLFVHLDTLSSNDFDALTNITLSEITEAYEVKKGSPIIDSVQVGDIIGFRTDYASSNPYHYGIMRINAIHPTTVNRYDGNSYVVEFDILTQQ